MLIKNLKKMATTRITFIDNIRIFLTALVVLFHLITTYGAPGQWYYVETKAEFPVNILMSIFIATNQAFFMGMFFMVSSFFLLPSLTRKGTKHFVKLRLLRLGVPLAVFYFLLAPLTYYIRDKFINGIDSNLISYFLSPEFWAFGPMWFVEALLIFTFLFFLIRKFIENVNLKFPGVPKNSSFCTCCCPFAVCNENMAAVALDDSSYQFKDHLFYTVYGIIYNWNNRLPESLVRRDKNKNQLAVVRFCAIFNICCFSFAVCAWRRCSRGRSKVRWRIVLAEYGFLYLGTACSRFNDLRITRDF